MDNIPWTTFRQELYRLDTFQNLHPTIPVSCLKLAEAGFLCRADGSIVCYFCGLVKNEWSIQDDPMEVHRELCPDCPLVTGEGCDNVPVGNSQPVERLAESLQRLQGMGTAHPADTTERTNYTSSCHASAGGASSASETEAQACRAVTASHSPSSPDQHIPGQPSGQEEEDHHFHHRHHQPPRMDLMGTARSQASPDRPGILDNTAQPELPSSTLQFRPRAGAEVVTSAQLGIITDNPQQPGMATLPSRLATFQGGPEALLPTPVQLAEAGFYYAGCSDRVRCFFCGGGIKNWNPTSDPWLAHARRFPTCAYVRQCQGQVFVDVVRELHSEDETQSISMAQVRREIDRRHAGAGQSLDLSADPAVCSAVYVGYSQRTVEHAAQRLLAEEMEIDSLQRENRSLRRSGQCKICMDKEVSIIFLRCGHLVTCITCAPALRTCPICRWPIKGRVQVFQDRSE